MYPLRAVEAKVAKGKKAPRVQLMGSGSILREVEKAAEILATEYGVSSDTWSATSFTELRKDGLAVDRWNRLHPTKKPKTSYVAKCLTGREGPVIASTDYMKAYPDLIRPWIDRPFHVLGTDGFGRSDTREALRRFFEIDRAHVVVAALKALADEGKVEAKVVEGAIQKFGINPDAPEPVRS
jgi:pyruvate dehydrogenase E1 component